MSKTIHLRETIQEELKKIHENVHNEDVPMNTAYPYIVYELESVGENYQLEINIYDKGTSTRTVETLADTLESYFKNYIYRDSNHIFTVDKNARNTIKEQEPNIKRRRVLFDLIYYGKE